MSKGNKLKFQRGAAAKRKAKIETTAERIVTMTVTVRLARENLQCSQPCGDLSKDTGRERRGDRARH